MIAQAWNSELQEREVIACCYNISIIRSNLLLSTLEDEAINSNPYRLIYIYIYIYHRLIAIIVTFLMFLPQWNMHHVPKTAIAPWTSLLILTFLSSTGKQHHLITGSCHVTTAPFLPHSLIECLRQNGGLTCSCHPCDTGTAYVNCQG